MNTEKTTEKPVRNANRDYGYKGFVIKNNKHASVKYVKKSIDGWRSGTGGWDVYYRGKNIDWSVKTLKKCVSLIDEGYYDKKIKRQK